MSHGPHSGRPQLAGSILDFQWGAGCESESIEALRFDPETDVLPGAERPVGSIAGFELLVADNFLQGPEIAIKGATTYSAKITDSALGTIRSVEHTIQHLEDVAENLSRTITDNRKRLADTQAQVNAPFEYAERLAELVRRQQEIEDALDLTKNQAPSQCDPDVGDPEAPEQPTPE